MQLEVILAFREAVVGSTLGFIVSPTMLVDQIYTAKHGFMSIWPGLTNEYTIVGNTQDKSTTKAPIGLSYNSGHWCG